MATLAYGTGASTLADDGDGGSSSAAAAGVAGSAALPGTAADAGGMEDPDLVRFREQLRRQKAAQKVALRRIDRRGGSYPNDAQTTPCRPPPCSPSAASP